MTVQEYLDKRTYKFKRFWELYPMVKNLDLGYMLYMLEEMVNDETDPSPDVLERMCDIMDAVIKSHNDDRKKIFIFTSVPVGMQIGEDIYKYKYKRLIKEQYRRYINERNC